MTIVVLLILVLVWAAVLGPSLLRRRAQQRSVDSIGAFHRQLRVLQRTGPAFVDPIHRLDASSPAHVQHKLGGAGRQARIVVRPDVATAAHAVRSSVRRPDPYFRAEACRRRQGVLMALLGAVVCTGLLGAIPGAWPVLFVTAVAALALVGYVVLLVRLGNRAREREMKLRYLPQSTRHESSGMVRRAAVR